MTNKDIKTTAREAADAAREMGHEALDTVKDVAAEAASDAKSALLEEATAQAEAGKDAVADKGQDLAREIRKSADAKGEESFQSHLLNNVASCVSDISEDLRGRSLSSMVEQVEDFARRNPGAFVAGAAVAGFALARFTQASGNRTGNTDGAGEPHRPESRS